MTPGLHFVGPDYFRVHGAVLAAGARFGPGDDFAARRVVVVNETMARLLWPGQSAIGRRVNFGRPTGGTMDEPWAEVVGVVRDIRHGGVEQAPRPHVYRSAMQYARSRVRRDDPDDDSARSRSRRRARGGAAVRPGHSDRVGGTADRYRERRHSGHALQFRRVVALRGHHHAALRGGRVQCPRVCHRAPSARAGYPHGARCCPRTPRPRRAVDGLALHDRRYRGRPCGRRCWQRECSGACCTKCQRAIPTCSPARRRPWR